MSRTSRRIRSASTRANANDAARLLVDGEMIIDAWDRDPKTRKRGRGSGEVELAVGVHHLRVEYYESLGIASMMLAASFEGEPPAAVPSDRLIYPGDELDEDNPCAAAGAELEAVEQNNAELARGYRRIDIDKPKLPGCTSVAVLDVTGRAKRYEKTGLLLHGQERAVVAILVDGGNVTLAAPFDSGLNFLEALGLSGGMPTVVSVPKAQLKKIEGALGLPPNSLDDLGT